MSTYRTEWSCCGSVTETESWQPEACPLCQLTAERERADDRAAVVEACQTRLDAAGVSRALPDGAGARIGRLARERDALRERVARLVGAMQDIARSEVWYASELREMARTALGDK